MTAVVVRPFLRAPCPVCGVEYQVRVDGTVRAHGLAAGVPRCDGSGMKPEGER